MCETVKDEMHVSFLAQSISGLHKENLSWRTRVGKLQKVGKRVPSHVKLESHHYAG